MSEFSDQLCPRCHLVYLWAEPQRNALSRRDNQTLICEACGMEEAIIDATKVCNIAMTQVDIDRERTLETYIKEHEHDNRGNDQ